MSRKKKWGARKRQHSKGTKRPRSWHRKNKTPAWLIEKKLKTRRERREEHGDSNKNSGGGDTDSVPSDG